MAKDIWEILLAKLVIGFNVGKGLLNNPMWTMGTMLFAEFVIMGLLVYIEKPYLTLLMPVSVVMGMGFWMNNVENTNHATWLGLFSAGMLRIYLLTCFGIVCCWIYQRLRQCQFTTAGKWCLTAVELLGYLWYISLLYFVKGDRFNQFYITIVVTFLIALTLSGKSFTSELFPQSRATNFFAEWSLAIYMSHRLVGRWFLYAYPGIKDAMYQNRIAAVIAALAISLLYLFVMRLLFRLSPILFAKAKKLLLKAN